MTINERFWSKVQEQGDCWVQKRARYWSNPEAERARKLSQRSLDGEDTG